MPKTPTGLSSLYVGPSPKVDSGQVKDALAMLHALFEEPANWTKRWTAYTAEGEKRETFSPDASCHCALSGVFLVSHSITGVFPESLNLSSAVELAWLAGITARDAHWLSLVLWNDRTERTHAQVLDTLQAAYDLA